MTQAEKLGLCEGLSCYFLYSKDNEQEKIFFDRLWTISNAKWDKDESLSHELEIELTKLTNHIRWFHHGSGFFLNYPDDTFGGRLDLVRQENETPIIHEFGITSVFTQDEFLSTIKQCLNYPRMVLLPTGHHCMALYTHRN